MSIQRGDIYFVNLNPVHGPEQAGQRPVLVLSIDAINRLPLVVTVVVGTKGANVLRDYDQRSDCTNGQRAADRNRLSVLSNPLARCEPFSSYARRQTQWASIGTG